jgi:hypothetical protein
MAFPTLAIQDCFEISSKFERGAHHSPTEESVFAMMTPMLNNMRTTSAATLLQIESNRALRQSALSLRGQGLAEDDDESYNPQEDGKSIHSDEDVGEIIADKIKECLPCEFRFDLAEDVWDKLWKDMEEHWTNLGTHYERMISQLLGLQDFFNLDDSIADICAMQEFFTEFVCIPDLRRLIAGLMALLAKLAQELSSVFDIIMMLVGPLVLPFLSSVVNVIQQFINMIIKPLQCIIDAMVKFLDKLDYSALYQSGENTNLSIGPQGKKGGRGEVKVKGSKVTAKRFETPDLDLIGIEETEIISSPEGADTEVFSYDRPDLNWGATVDLNPFSEVTRQEQAAIDKADADIKKLKKARAEGKVDMSDPEQKANYEAQLAAARERKSDAIEEKSKTEIQRVKEQLVKFKTYIKSVFTKLLSYVREVIDVIESLAEDIFGEFKKFVESMVGGGDRAMQKMFKKLEILKIIELITAMIALLSNERHCDEDPVDIPGLFPNRQGLTVWTDDQGNVHIEEDPEEIETAIDLVVQAIGEQPFTGKQDQRAKVIKDTPTENSARQKLNSLIEFTGDPVLDSSVARLVEGVATPSRTVFRCPLQTSVAQAEQVNKWIRELNSE